MLVCLGNSLIVVTHGQTIVLGVKCTEDVFFDQDTETNLLADTAPHRKLTFLLFGTILIWFSSVQTLID